MDKIVKEKLECWFCCKIIELREKNKHMIDKLNVINYLSRGE